MEKSHLNCLPSGQIGTEESPQVKEVAERRRPRVTLQLLASDAAPNPSPICVVCTNALWFQRSQNYLCYCRVMNAIIYNSSKPNPVLACDGVFRELDRALLDDGPDGVEREDE